MLIFEWNEGKAAKNLRKHKVSFELAKLAFDDPFLLNRYDRTIKGEDRYQTLPLVGNVILFVVNTHEEVKNGEEIIRIISARKADKKSEPAIITDNLIDELKALEKMPDSEIDYSDIPQQLDWSDAVVGKFYRPLKQQVSIRVDLDVLAWFKSQGSRGYIARMGQALREYVQAKSKSHQMLKRRG